MDREIDRAGRQAGNPVIVTMTKSSVKNKLKNSIIDFPGEVRGTWITIRVFNSSKADAAALIMLKHHNTDKVIENAPGVEVGDEIQSKVELSVIELYCSIVGAVDHVKEGEMIFASCIVSLGGYDDKLESDVINIGQGVNVIRAKKQREDQKLEKGNLALANSMCYKRPMRVIPCEARPSSASSASDARGKTYFYDGLYLVEEICSHECDSL